MGALTSRQNSREEEVDTSSNILYRYPPKTGNYFGSHFIMGGEKFDTPQPEAYLFGENADLNFLGNKPTPFPYPPPQSSEPYKTLKALINIRKESLRFVKVNDDSQKQMYNIEFVFDCDVPCSITIHFFASEDSTNNTISYIPKNSSISHSSKAFHYLKGASQLFCQPSVTFVPSQFEDDELCYNVDKEVFPIAIHCVTLSDDDPKQSHTTIAVVDHHADGCYTLKGLKQKLHVDGLCYLLQEIYGIENKNNETYKGCEDCEDGGSECVICMSDMRDTLILPCRHLCLCYSCADSLRYQANNCPICRAPFRALLQIRALQKNASHVTETSNDNVPSGYDAVSLIEALNGPCALRHNPPLVLSLDPLADNQDAQTAAQVLNRRSSGERSGKKQAAVASQGTSPDEDVKNPSSGTDRVKTPEVKVRMSSLIASQEALASPDERNDHKSPPLTNRKPVVRDKNALLRSSRPTTVAPQELDENETQDEDSEAEKLSPLLDAGTSTQLDTSADLAEYYGTNKGYGTSERRKTQPASAQVEFYGTTERRKSQPAGVVSAAAELYGTKERRQKVPLERASVAHSDQELGKYFGGDMQLKVEIVGSPSASEVTTITQVESVPGSLNKGEESDYYTPDDPSTTILSPVMEQPDAQKQSKGTPTPMLKSNNWNTSLPGTPLSTASHRSSGDSYSSSSSTKLLLTYENSTT